MRKIRDVKHKITAGQNKNLVQAESQTRAVFIQNLKIEMIAHMEPEPNTALLHHHIIIKLTK